MKNSKLQHFRDAMHNFSKDYVLIGGNACELLAESRKTEFRETEDLDIVLIIERWSPEFASALNSYIEEGGYQGRRYTRGKGGDGNVHRFTLNEEHPNARIYPREIELFSRAPDGIELAEEQYIVPVETVDRISNFSAILLDEDYYAYLQESLVNVEDIRIPNIKCLTALKASAWLGNEELYDEQKIADIGTVYKHAFDICRLFAMYEDDELEDAQPVPSRVFEDIEKVRGKYENPEETSKLSRFIEENNLTELPVTFDDAGRFLPMAFKNIS
ncbi:hypothetical protein [Pseudoalteromonas sp. Ps84H-4]|uniref:hypothetical protein n=1 Tax=Pseudoalteromonas sp. Ps84H-4 TaxID=2954502 RepID=UPI002097612A|nr:hypothetical protein [Pseudoalteromonas sp. Ps84H-4]MCO7248827.1 hypothetical protein [Pseudoalteromonas sp. Ps84H-4]